MSLRERWREWRERRGEDEAVREEMRFHIEQETERNIRRGLPPEQARREALVAFGGVERFREHVREERTGSGFSELAGDVRYGFRSLSKAPTFAAVAVLTLGLGIGASAAIFGLVDGILLRPLPYDDPDELVLAYQENPEQGISRGTVSLPDFEDWEARTRSFARMAAFIHLHQIFSGRGEAVEVRPAYVTEGFFEVFGVPPRLGRPLSSQDLSEAAPNIVVSERFWRNYLGADSGAIGTTVLLQGEPHVVIGVMPSSFRFPTPETDIWAPESLLQPYAIGPKTRENRLFEVVARLDEGVDPDRATSELSAVAAQLQAEYPGTNTGWGDAGVVPLRTAVVGDVDAALGAAVGAVAFLLLIACANLANLLLARGTSRSREIAIRVSLGATRRRILRQLLTESVLLAVLGGVLGLALAYWGVQATLALSADTLPRMDTVQVDARVFAFGLLLSLATVLLFGLLPALRTARTDPQSRLRAGRGGIGAGSPRLRSALVVAEVGFAFMLLIGAGLMARSFLELRSVDPGFDAEGALMVSLHLSIAGVPLQEIGPHLVERRNEIVERVRGLPGVTRVGMVNAFPLRDEGGPMFELRRADGSGMPDGSPLRANVRYVSAGYFEAMGIPLISGSSLPDDWAPGAPLPVVLSETAARRFWPGEDPVGQLIDPGWAEAVITGVVGDVREAGLSEEPAPMLYFPQQIAPRILATLVVRTAGDPATLAAPIRQIIREVDPGQAVRAAGTLSSLVSESIATDRFFTFLFGLFGSLALLLSTVGLYGVLAYSVGQRTREIGLRMALGARAREVLGMVVGGGLRLVALGVVLGGAGALLVTRILESQLFGVSATDPLTFLAVAAALFAVAALASYLPAHRAARVDPMVTLRID